MFPSWTAVVKDEICVHSSILRGNLGFPLSQAVDRLSVSLCSGGSALGCRQTVNCSREPCQSSAIEHQIDADCQADKVGTGCGPGTKKISAKGDRDQPGEHRP